MFERTLRIIDEETLLKIQKANILLVGVGGVGGFALEALVRLGFQNITIIDNDIIEESNLNRQIISNTTNIGLTKTNVAKDRAISINKNINIITKTIFLDKDNIDSELNNNYDYIIDACDTITTKYLLIKYALDNNIKIISSMGTGNRINPSKIEITTLNKTYNDPLAKSLRNILRKNNVSLKIPVIWSSELPVKTKTRSPGSCVLVPASAGLNIAYYILNDLIKSQ
jgi:tRNA A37 threonylcarbamoyladenosine dehydratase